MKTGPRGPNGDAKGGRDLRQRVPEVVVEDDDRSLPRRQLAEGMVEVVSRGDGARHIRRGGKVRLEQPHAGHVTTFAAGFRVAGVDDQAMEPGVKPLAVAQGREVTPGAEHRLLGGILRTVWITQDPKGEGIAVVDARRHQGRECVLVAVPGPLDELGLHRALRIVAFRLTALPSMEPAVSETFSRDVGMSRMRGGRLAPSLVPWTRVTRPVSRPSSSRRMPRR